MQKHKEPQRKAKKTKRPKNKIKNKYKWNNIMIALCAVAFLFYFGDSLIRKADRSNIETTFIGYGNVKSSIEKEIVIIRNDRVLLAPSDGHYELIYPEGDRVKKGQPIAKTKNQESSEDYNELIEIIEARINDIENPNVSTGESNDLTAINNKLEALYRNLQARVQNDEVEYIDKIKREIEVLNDKKQYYFMDEENITKDKLLEEKNRLINEKTNKNSTIYSDSVGLVSSYYDKNESVLNIPNIKNLSVSQLNKIENTSNIDYTSLIKKGEPVAVISDNSKWYFACEVTKGDIDVIESEKSMAVEIDDVKFNAKLEDFYKDKSGRFVGYFRVEDDRFSFFEKRKYTANLIHQSSEGIAIPNEALTQYQGKTGVFVVERTGVAHFKAISDIAAQDNKFTAVEYAYITEAGKNSVNIYDEIILNPNNIEEGQRVK